MAQPLNPSHPSSSFAHVRLTSSSVISDLATYEFAVDINVTGEVVAAQFNLNSYLPGVIVTKEGKIVSAISRRRFLALVGRRFGVEIYLSRPISAMVNSVIPPHLTLRHDCNIHMAAETALARPSDLFYDPIIVAYPDGSHRILDIYTLILAQSFLLTLFYQEEQNQRQLAESLQKTGQALSSTLDLTDLNNKILQQLAKVVRYDRGTVFISTGTTIKSIAAHGFPRTFTDDSIEITLPDDPDDVYLRIMRTKKPVIVPDTTEIKTWNHLPEITVNKSWMGVPLIVQDQVIGMISLSREEADKFTLNNAYLVSTFAGQAAIALDNARLYNQLESFNVELEQMVAERTQELHKTYALLEQLDRTKGDFISVTAHELRTPLTIIKGYAQLLDANQYFEADSIEHSAVKGILSGMGRMHRVVNGMLDIARIDNQAVFVSADPADVAQIIDSLNSEFNSAIQERQITIHSETLDQLPKIEGDQDILYKLFYALLTNAIKYTPDQGEVTWSGDLQQNEQGFPEGITIHIKDTGIGIDPAHQELIFQKFYQTGKVSLHSSGLTKFKGGGPGLGLAIAKGIVEAHHGRIWVESEGHNEETFPGSTFSVYLPLRQPAKSNRA